MKKLINFKNIILLVLFLIISYFVFETHKLHNYKKKLVYNDNILKETLSRQISFLKTDEGNCHEERIKISKSIIKHLKINQTNLKNLGFEKKETQIEKDFNNILKNCQ